AGVQEELERVVARIEQGDVDLAIAIEVAHGNGGGIVQVRTGDRERTGARRRAGDDGDAVVEAIDGDDRGSGAIEGARRYGIRSSSGRSLNGRKENARAVGGWSPVRENTHTAGRSVVGYGCVKDGGCRVPRDKISQRHAARGVVGGVDGGSAGERSVASVQQNADAAGGRVILGPDDI